MRNISYLPGGLIFCLLGLSAAPALSQVAPFVFEEHSSAIDIRLSAYTVSISKDPYRLTILRGGQPIAESAPHGGSFFYRSGTPFYLSRVQEYSESLDCIALKVETTAPGVSAGVVLTPFEDNLLVRWSLGDGGTSEKMGESFLLRTSGHWYGGNVTSGHNWPLEKGKIELDPFLSTSNQTTPFWLTSRGAGFFVPSYQPMGFSINKDGDGLFSFNVKETGSLEYRILAGGDIVDVYDSFAALAGHPRVTPPRGYFARPIFNTWIELKKNLTQDQVLDFARAIRQNDIPCEVFMIDDMWQRAYGDHVFDQARFPDPKGMIGQIHEMGFKLILWVVPFIDFDAGNFAFLRDKGYLVLDSKGRKPCRVPWWNGESSLIDLSRHEAFNWFVGELKNLQVRYGVDGFKLDAGDAEFFKPGFQTFGRITPNRYTDLFAEIGAHFAINEFRVSWLAQPLGLVQRLRDKNNNWGVESGLGSLIPHGLTESMIGYAYFCPDIIGGGESGDFTGQRFKGMDPELFVRWTQASALMPMMQFSFAPWNLDQESIRICRRYARLHEQLGDYIYDLALKARETGRPITRPLFFRNILY